ncbi:MAG: hypothetical protein EOP51_22205 [Sphingobacteriales bacterium]|nr:MAG: hypothetical protein EOP51_22205 [Sphingobacteriales bacterium]
MEQFKLDIFKSETGEDLDFTTINDVESDRVKKVMLNLLGLADCSITTQGLFKYLEGNIAYKTKYPRSDIDGDFMQIMLKKLNVSYPTTGYILWDMTNKVDQFDLEYLIKNWDSVWFGVSDEALMLYLPNYKIVLLMTDHGYIGHNLFA